MTDIVLITGANKGLGYEAARRLHELGATVLLGSRDADRGEEAGRRLGVRAVQIDVTSDASVDKAAGLVEAEYGRLDVLVNNAGIVGSRVPPLEAGADDFRECYETNVFGPARVTRAFLPLLRRSGQPRIVMVTSGLGSHAITTDPDHFAYRIDSLVYPSSKAALNMITTQYAKALPGFQVNLADPGYTATDLNANSGHQTVEEGTDTIVRLATLAADGPTGGFFDRAGTVPW